jgi:galactokinase
MNNFFVSGRIEFLGKHTDYCGGRSLVCAIDKGFTVNFEPNNDDVFINFERETTHEGYNEVMTLTWHGDCSLKDHWTKYPQTVIERIKKNFTSRKLFGVDINFSSNLPQAAGVSSSSAFVVAIFLAISKANNLEDFAEYKQNIRDKFELGNYLGCLENGYDFGELKGNQGVGTFGGSQDQTAIICCKENYLSRFSFRPVKHEGDFHLPENLVFVIASSGVIAEKTGDAMHKYNRLSLLAKEIEKKFDENLSLAQIVEKYGFEELKTKLNDQNLIQRLTQFYIESYEIIPKVSEHLEKGEIEQIGELIDLSHQNADKYLENQTSETNFLQANARENGAIAASAFGAGFGGSVYALVESEKAEDFMQTWKENYQTKFPQLKSEFFITKAAESKF